MSTVLQTPTPAASHAAHPLRFRDAHPDELPRAGHLFPHAVLRRGEPRAFLALRSHPAERIVGGVCWREARGPDGAELAEFRWGALPALRSDGGERGLLEAFIDRMQAQTSVRLLRTAGPLPDGAQAELLRETGFDPVADLEVYEGHYASWVARTRRLLARGPRLAPGTVLATPEAGHADALVELATRRHALMQAESLRAALTPGAPGGFDPAVSVVLLEGETLLGACLVKRAQPGRITVPVLVVDADATLPAGHACALMFGHCQRLLDREGVEQVEFMTNPVLSPGMPRIARRFGCRLLRTLTTWRRVLRAASKEDGGTPRVSGAWSH